MVEAVLPTGFPAGQLSPPSGAADQRAFGGIIPDRLPASPAPAIQFSAPLDCGKMRQPHPRPSPSALSPWRYRDTNEGGAGRLAPCIYAFMSRFPVWRNRPAAPARASVSPPRQAPPISRSAPAVARIRGRSRGAIRVQSARRWLMRKGEESKRSGLPLSE